jgi:hypothetical protein
MESPKLMAAVVAGGDLRENSNVLPAGNNQVISCDIDKSISVPSEYEASQGDPPVQNKDNDNR